MNHTNSLNGIRLGQDPILLCMETGNEMGKWRLGNGAPPKSWVQAVAKKIKSINPNMLVMNGTDGVVKDHLDIAEVDIHT